MASPDRSSLFATTLGTTVHLIDQFTASLSAPLSQRPPEATQSPLPLLTASAAALKQNVTRLSLLTLTPPFTPAAIAPLLNTLNMSILPSLVTASHLTTSAAYTDAFSVEAASLTKQCLSDLKGLLALIGDRASSRAKNISNTEKDAVTQVTGQVWARCDALATFAEGGLAGFMTQKVGQWLELMRDAVKELEEWDPREEVGDDPFGLDQFDDEEGKDDTVNADNSGDRAILQAGVKTEALKVLTRIPQSIHVVVKQRLGASHLPPADQLSSAQRSTLDAVVSCTRKISESIDESAEAMYMGDLERCLKMAGEARSLAIDVVESVKDPWTSGSETKEDLYIRRALQWIRQVKPVPGESTSGLTAMTDAMKATNIS